ncbi:anti-sigma F factor [Caproiciproducens sp.]|uniref:anti-sigma F factor n=1 Tax=Caproiciproducens sp. TaxID=1954376 RepID=UPI00289A4756|nr:anti-sigma F factor [Caproiciproducens sp.]
MKPINEMSVSFLSCSANESFGRAAVAAFAAQLDPTIDELSDIKTAVSEAVTNCIVHAYRDTIGIIYITCKLYDSGKISIRIRDKGCGIEDVKQAMQPLFSTAEDGERAGLGFAVMESFMDVLRVTSKPGHGTSVTMYKTIERRRTEKNH